MNTYFNTNSHAPNLQYGVTCLIHLFFSIMQLNKKFSALQTNLKKLENVLYELSLTMAGKILKPTSTSEPEPDFGGGGGGDGGDEGEDGEGDGEGKSKGKRGGGKGKGKGKRGRDGGKGKGKGK